MEHNNLPSNNSACTNSLTFSQTNDLAAINAAVNNFGEDFKQMVWLRHNKPSSLVDAVKQRAVTFHDVSAFFTQAATLFWLRYHIAETFTFLGIYDTASKYQVRETARMILEHEIYGQLTLAEFLVFLNRFKRGDYGKIYNSNRPNPQEFLSCLRPFWDELRRERVRQDQEEQDRRSSQSVHSKENCTWEEYCAMKGINKPSPITTASNDSVVGTQ